VSLAFPNLLNWKGLLGTESVAAITSVIGVIVTVTMLPETKGKREINPRGPRLHSPFHNCRYEFFAVISL
jgi:hypothetical protein